MLAVSNKADSVFQQDSTPVHQYYAHVM